MPAQTGASAFLAKIGTRFDKAVKDHANDETDFGWQELPPMKGVARLTECGFYQYDKDTKAKKLDGSSAAGEWYFRIKGTVVHPRTAADPATNSVRVVEGASLPMKIIPVMDTRNSAGEVTTAEEHLTSARDNVLNELRKLGATVDSKRGAAQLVPLAAAVLKSAPYFKFSITEGKEDPNRVNPATGKPWPARNWTRYEGVVPDYVPGGEDVIDDDTVAAPSANGAAGKPNRQAAAAPPDAAQDDVGDATYTDQDDVDSLLLRANSDDGDAQQRLKELAMAAGHPEETCEDTTTWEELAALANEPPADGAGEDGFAKEWSPQKDQVYPVKVKVWDAKTKKYVVAKKPVDCEVTVVDNVAGVVTLRNLVTGKPVVDQAGKPQWVAWDDLIRE